MRPRRIVMATRAKSGEIIEIRALILHPMLTGHGSGVANSVPRDIVHALEVTYDGEMIFRAEMFPGVAANPSIAFTTIATRTGEITFTWLDDSGGRTVETRLLTVEA